MLGGGGDRYWPDGPPHWLAQTGKRYGSAESWMRSQIYCHSLDDLRLQKYYLEFSTTIPIPLRSMKYSTEKCRWCCHGEEIWCVAARNYGPERFHNDNHHLSTPNLLRPTLLVGETDIIDAIHPTQQNYTKINGCAFVSARLRTDCRLLATAAGSGRFDPIGSSQVIQFPKAPTRKRASC